MGERGIGMIAHVGLACIAAAAIGPGIDVAPSPGQGRKSRQGRTHRTSAPPMIAKRDRSESLDRMLRRAKPGGRR